MRRPSVQCFSTTYLCLGRRGRSQSYLDFPLLTHLLQFIWGNTKAFPTQARNIVSHVCLALL